MRNAFFYFLVLLPAACTATANVGDFPSSLVDRVDGGADASSETAPPTAEGGSSDSSTPDAFVDAGCGIGFAQQGAFIDVQYNNGPPPQYTGGTIVAGVYVLKSMTYYSLKNGTAQRRETLNVRGGGATGAFERIIEQKNPTGDYEAIAAHAETSTFMRNDPFFLDENLECPDFSTATGDYEVSGTTLKILTGGGEEYERVYERAP